MRIPQMANKKSHLPLSVIMLTLNEQYHLPGVIENVKDWAADIFIVDSCSIDRTVDIALEHDVKIVQRPFTNFGDQWNFAINRLPIQTPWTLKLDPDERLSDELKLQIEKVIRNNDAHEGYKFKRRLWFMGKPLHAKQDVVRLWKTSKCRFSNTIVNEHPIIEGNIGSLTGILEHHDSYDLHHWYDKQNRHGTMEAIMRYRGDKLAARTRLFGTPLERRMFLKKMFFKVPLRYFLLYFYHLIGQGAWRNGKTGRAWARLRTEVYRMIELKFEEIQYTKHIPEIPRPEHRDYDHRILASQLQQQLYIESVNKCSSKAEFHFASSDIKSQTVVENQQNNL